MGGVYLREASGSAAVPVKTVQRRYATETHHWKRAAQHQGIGHLWLAIPATDLAINTFSYTLVTLPTPY